MSTDREKLKELFDGILKFCDEQNDPTNEQFLLEELNNMLDILAEGDFFGTEAQCDPRKGKD